MPIYPDYNSAEVFKNKDMYQLKDGFKYVSGASPDYFDRNGQKWGHPLYDFEEMKKDNYKWWVRRVEVSTKLFNTIRIDHFRGFDSYYAIPYGDTTAKNGKNYQIGINFAKSHSKFRIGNNLSKNAL